jgi:hypothetical protein
MLNENSSWTCESWFCEGIGKKISREWKDKDSKSIYDVGWKEQKGMKKGS